VKKQRLILTVATLLMAYMEIVTLNGSTWGSTWWVGEPQLPQKLNQ